MLRTVPYDDLTSEATNATVLYVQLIHTDEAIVLLAQRQPLLLALLKAHAAPSAIQAQSAHPPLTIHDLYADAIALPAMLQFANRSKAAASAFAELEAAVPAGLSPDDAILTAGLRRQYLLLGSPLPQIPASAWLLDPTAFAVPGDLNTRFGASSIFLLFPDWCAQCVAAGQRFMPAAARLNKSGVYFYALLAQADPKPPIPDMEWPRQPLHICGVVLSLFVSSFEDRASSSLSRFERRLISLIFAGRNRIIMIRRELPLTKVASPAEPVA